MTFADARFIAPSRTVVWPLAAFLFVAACTVLPILAHLNLPLVDLPNHIARLSVAATEGQGPLAEYYGYGFSLVPNAAIDLLWRGLGYPIDTARFANLVMASYAMNMVLATMVLARVVHGHWTLWSAAVGLIVFNGPFFWGFQNFVWSLPFCLYALGLWLVLEKRSTALRVGVFLPIAFMIYLMHFFAFGFFAVLVFGREVQTWFELRERRLSNMLHRAVLMAPFALLVLWLAYTLREAPPSPAGSFTTFGSLEARFRMFGSFLLAPNVKEFPLLNGLGAVGLAVLFLVFSRLWTKSGPRLVVAPQLMGPAIALTCVALCVPTWLNGVALVDIRAPVLLGAVMFAGTTWHGLTYRHARALVIVFSLLILSRAVAFDRFAAWYQADVEDMYATTELLPAGARLLPLRGPGKQIDERLFHIQALLVGRNEVFVPTLFQGVHALTVKERWADYAHPALFAIDIRYLLDPELSEYGPVFKDNWEEKFNFALLIDTMPAFDDPRLRPIAQQGRFTLFAIEPDGDGAG